MAVKSQSSYITMQISRTGNFIYIPTSSIVAIAINQKNGEVSVYTFNGTFTGEITELNLLSNDPLAEILDNGRFL